MGDVQASLSRLPKMLALSELDYLIFLFYFIYTFLDYIQ